MNNYGIQLNHFVLANYSMKSKFLLVLMSFTLMNSLLAQEISVQEIQRAAINAFDRYANSSPSPGPVSISDSWKIVPQPIPHIFPAFFICIRSEGGFVILSGDLSAEPVIAYNLTGTIDPSDLPPGCEEWLETVRLQIEWIHNKRIEATHQIRQRWKTLLSEEVPDQPYKIPFSSGISPEHSFRSVEPLITTKWGQRSPYNQFCPVDPASPDGHAVTGCAATALAQVMAYYDYPLHGTGSNSY